jgi:hypothetical protein
LMKHPERLRRWAPDTLETRTLQFLVEARREIVDDKTRYLNRLTAQLKLYFPQLLSWFDVDQVVVGELLLRWPTLEQLQQARSSRVAQWLKQHGLSPARVAELQQAIAAGVAATRDEALIQSGCLAAQRLVGQLQLLRKSITAYDQRIAQLVGAHPDHALFQSLPGAGPVMVPRLIAAFGTQRERFQSASEIQCYSGIAPVTAASGKQKWIHWRWACPKFLRQTFHEWASFSRRKSAWAKAYYDLQRQQGKSHHASVRALAFKWLRIVFRCWKDAKPYDEARYLQALQKHAKPVEIPVNKIPGLTPIKDLFA